jgi:hypothetical protein
MDFADISWIFIRFHHIYYGIRTTVFVGVVVATRGELQKAKYPCVMSNYKIFSLKGAQVPVGDHKH